ncbi:EAL domain-containing protein [Nodosilinea sp. LEGE 07298]|nr:EAL domain-containing protein [Nodosilinea sp. LEGE 07298]
MAELLQRRTSLSVSVIEHEMLLALNHIYILPPGMVVSLHGQQLQLEERRGGIANYPIDHFFLSLARERGDRTIGIVLSGTGRDGTEGLKAISRSGGIALVQSRETAQFGAMPTSPISSGLVDEILSPEALAQAVCDIIRYTETQATAGETAGSLLPDEQLTRILDILQQQENIDFSLYKTGTLHRRIVHRLLLSRADTVEDYLTYLAETPEEVKDLRQDLLIGATRFFRDPDMWTLLQQDILPALLETLQPQQPLRLWVAACSTGEEAYSLAIAVYEVMQRLGKSHPVKLFATDIDQEALLIASQGIYSRKILPDLGAERLERFFTPEGSDYRIKKFIRTQVIFASQDLTKNPGFSQMHLVSCRNLLIYMQASLQEQVLKLLHFSLTSQGVLVLGPSEHLGTLSHGFDTLNQHWNFFRKRQDVQLPVNRTVASPMVQSFALARPSKTVRSPYEHLLSEVLKLRFGQSPVTCLLIDNNLQVLHILLNTARLLDFPLGEMNTSVLDLVLPSLKIPLSTALHRARRDCQPVLYSAIQVTELEPGQRLNLWVGNVNSETVSPEGQLIVLLEVEPLTQPAERESDTEFDPDSDISRHVQELEYELQQTRENLQTSIEELETANEEQQATNEELLASNEELQSTNEELQSANEELYTVNADNHERIRQLSELTTDIDNLLQSTDIGVVFLDRALNIRKFTPAATEVFNFRVGDTGRPLAELVNHLDIDNLVALIQQVIETQTSQETEATNLQTGDRLLLRILPYRREDGTTDGVVLTLVIINDLKQFQEALLQSNQLLESLYQNSPLGLCLLDQEMRFVKVNPTLAAINGLSIEAHIGQPVPEILPDFYETVRDYFQQVLTTNSPVTFEISGTTPAQPSVERTWLASYYPVMLGSQRRGVGAIITDITEQKQIQSNLVESKALVQQIAEASPAILALFELPSGKTTYINSAIETLLGYTPDEIYQDGEEILALHIHPKDMAKVQAHFTALTQAPIGEILGYEYRVCHKDGSWHWIYQRNVVFNRDATGAVQQVLGVGTDITELVQTQEELQHNEMLLRTTLESTPIVLFTQDLDLCYTWIHNPVPGFRMEDMLGHSDRDFLAAAEAEELIQLKQHVLDTGETRYYEFELRTGGPPRVFDLTFAPQRNFEGEIVGLTGVGIDITRTKHIENQLQRVSTKQPQSTQVVVQLGDWDYTLNTGQMSWSDEVFAITGFNPQESVPSVGDVFCQVYSEDRPQLVSLANQLYQIQTSFSLDFRIHSQLDDSIKFVNVLCRPRFDHAENLIGLYGTVMDITDQKQSETSLEQQAFFDFLTQLPNRHFFLEHLKLFIRRVSRDTTYQFTVLYLDLDDFKAVNDTLGHSAGDQVLIEVARRLEDALRPGDIVSRLGGDEFAILLEKTSQLEQAMDIALRIQGALSVPISLPTTQVSTTTSIGIAFYSPEDPWDSQTSILENADIAMYLAKRQGPGNIQVFDPGMRTERIEQVELKISLRQALRCQEFVLYYQPIVNLSDRKLVGFEVLVRWQHPQHGLLTPFKFLPLMQSSRLMIRLESWILEQACHQLSQWAAQFDIDPSFRFHINISPEFMIHDDFLNNLKIIFNETAVKPQQICLEITENVFVGYGKAVDECIKGLKQLGVHIALDDFGTGFSSLSYLHRFPIDVIKIDQSFIRSLDLDPSLQRITQGIINLAESLNLSTVAEGIETLPQLQLLQTLPCHYGQGYLFSKPLPATAAEQLLQEPEPFI